MRIDRRWLHVVGLLAFAAATVYAVRHQPPEMRDIAPGWLALGSLLALASTFLQAIHTHVFLAERPIAGRLLVATWLTAERAWLNTLLPAKAGTLTAMAVISSKLGISMARYVRFAVLSATVTAMISLVGVAALLVQDPWARAAIIASVLLLVPASRWIYPVLPGQAFSLVGSGILTLLTISAGISTCIVGLGHASLTTQDSASIGLVLNLLSVVAITPGNFGVRELLLAAVSPILEVDMAVVLQGSACYVVLRLAASALLAMLLRPRALEALPSNGTPPPS